MKVFICHASGDKDIAAHLAYALRGAGFSVFLDESDLPPGGNYHARILKAVEKSDGFVFLVSNESIKEGRYTLTELQFAKTQWPHPEERVFPVIVAPVPIENIDPYLRAVTLLQPRGNVAAEVTAFLTTIRRRRRNRREVLVAAAALVLTLAYVVAQHLPAWQSRDEAAPPIAPSVIQPAVADRTGALPSNEQLPPPEATIATNVSNPVASNQETVPAPAAVENKQAAVVQTEPKASPPAPAVETKRVARKVTGWRSYRFDIFPCDIGGQPAQDAADRIRAHLLAAEVSEVRMRRNDPNYRRRAEEQGFAAYLGVEANIRYYGDDELKAAEAAADYLNPKIGLDLEPQEVSSDSPTPGILSIFVCPESTA